MTVSVKVDPVYKTEIVHMNDEDIDHVDTLEAGTPERIVHVWKGRSVLVRESEE